MKKGLTATYPCEDPNPISNCKIKKTPHPTIAMYSSHNPPAQSNNLRTEF